MCPSCVAVRSQWLINGWARSSTKMPNFHKQLLDESPEVDPSQCGQVVLFLTWHPLHFTERMPGSGNRPIPQPRPGHNTPPLLKTYSSVPNLWYRWYCNKTHRVGNCKRIAQVLRLSILFIFPKFLFSLLLAIFKDFTPNSSTVSRGCDPFEQHQEVEILPQGEPA